MPPAKKASKSVPKKTAAKPVSTRDRIIQRSIALFNKRGLQHVAIEHIASDLDISPGNLTYHFKHKRDLIRATIDVLKEYLNTALEKASQTTCAEESAASLIQIYRAFWDFRFYFNALTYLLTNDTELRKEYFAFREQLLEAIVVDLEQLNQRGFFLEAKAPNNFRLLAENMLSQWLDWLRLQQMQSPNARTPALYDCALHHWSLSQPFLKNEFSVELLEAFQRQLLKKPDPQDGSMAAKTGAAAYSLKQSDGNPIGL